MFETPFFPEQASSTAQSVDLLLLVLMIFSGFFSILIFLAIMYFIVRYHHGNRANRKPSGISSVKIEVAWITIPGLMLIGIFLWGAQVFFRNSQPPQNTLDVYVVAKQWMWKLQHPDGQREINELHVPLGQPVRLWMTSQDVIHSFYIPAFRVKQDVLPGRITYLWFEPIDTGEFHLFCAEYCGTEHSRMTGRIIVMEPEEYNRWLVTNTVSHSMAGRGEQLYQQLGCSGCHGAQPTVPAPKLNDLYGRLITLGDGETILADQNYIRDSILLPSLHLVAGYEDRMPSYQGEVTEEEIFALLEYIRSLNEPQGNASEQY